jgi:hypothetical protein
MSAHNSILQRVRFDGAYAFAAIFAVIGGYTLLGSYADSKPLKTFYPGTYTLNEYATKNTNEYRIGMSKTLSYCFSPYTVDATHPNILLTADKSVQLRVVARAPDVGCVRVNSNYSKVTLRFPQGITLPRTVTVQ